MFGVTNHGKLHPSTKPSSCLFLYFLADVNKDGKTDIVGFGDYGVYISLSMINCCSPTVHQSQNERIISDSIKVLNLPLQRGETNGEKTLVRCSTSKGDITLQRIQVQYLLDVV